MTDSTTRNHYSYKPNRNIFKGLKFAVFLFIILLMITSPIALPPTEGQLNLFSWSEYIPHSVILKFEDETGIKVNYSEYDSNETLYAKLKTNPKNSYDVLIPSAYFIPRLVQQNMLQKIDLNKIPNRKGINPILMSRSFDSHNEYSLPFAFGTTGIVVNDRYYDPKKITRWKDLWDPQFKNQLLLLNDPRDVFSMALHSLGYSINDKDPGHIYQAYLYLRKLIPNIKLFGSEATVSIYADEDARIGMSYNGGAYAAYRENHHLHYIYPKNSTDLWIDCFVIAKNAPHVDNAHRFINFILRPDISAEIVKANGYSSASLTAMQSLPADLRNNSIINPKPEQIESAELIMDVGDAKAVYEHYWQLLKISS